jgi:glycosyltransferase involved in cell wall biosynthesis
MMVNKQIRQGIEAYRWFRDRKRRRLPPLDVTRSAGASTVYYYAPSEPSPTGGMKVIYRHVDELNAMGISAAVVHDQEGFRCRWFENSTRVVSAKGLQLGHRDLLVVPEYYSTGLGTLPACIRLVVFNQGPHHTFDSVALDRGRPGDPYAGLKGLEGILTVSQDGADLLRLAFPDIAVSTARNVVDASVFHLPADLPSNCISYVPSRRPEELRELLHLLNTRREISSGSWELVALQGLSENGMASALRRSAVFLSLGERDGFGLPAAEAMGCGSYVVGYHGGGGEEFFDPSYCRPASSTTELFHALIDAMNLAPELRRELGAKASAAVLGRYTSEGLQADLAAFYGAVL